MTEDKDNIKQFSLNLVPPEDRDQELRDCLNRGVAVFTEQVSKENIQSFFAVILDETDNISIVAAGEQLPLKTIGALRSAEFEILNGMG